MKKILLSFLLILFCLAGTVTGIAQTPPNFDLIKLEKAPDYKAAEPFVLQTSRYLLAVPFNKDDKDQAKAVQFLAKWMTGTPDYSFNPGDVASKIFKGNTSLLTMFLVSMTKYSLENKEAAKDPKLVKLNSLSILIDYCNNKSNGLKMNKDLKKLAEAKEKGELEKALEN